MRKWVYTFIASLFSLEIKSYDNAIRIPWMQYRNRSLFFKSISTIGIQTS